MEEPKYNNSYYGDMGSFNEAIDIPIKRKYTIIQSFWTKPITDNTKLLKSLYIAALSLTYAHKNGYKVNMHTDSRGAELLKDFGYDKLLKTLDKIPDSVPTDLFAAGKFYAMKAEGIVDKVHIDIDVFLKKPGVLDVFYKDKKADFICQQEEDIEQNNHADKIYHMHILGYPTTTRPNWKGSMNTGIIGFHNKSLATKYFNNYFNALKIYTADKFRKYKLEGGYEYLMFDFILEQITLSYMSIGYKPYVLIPTYNATFTADQLGYQHLQGDTKWSVESQAKIRNLLMQKNEKLYSILEKRVEELKAKT